MNIITLTSDFGTGSHYVARVKGALYAQLGNISLIDIAHDIKPWDIEQAVFLFSATRKSIKGVAFHLFGVNDRSNVHLAAKTENQWFIAPDNGALPEILKQEQAEYYSLGEFNHPAFLERFYPEVVKSIREGVFPGTDTPSTEPVTKLFKAPVKQQRMMKAYFAHFDRYGNGILNLRREDFHAFVGKNPFKIHVNETDFINTISSSYYEETRGELIAVFNSAGFLEISFTYGDARQLFGLDKTQFVLIEI